MVNSKRRRCKKLMVASLCILLLTNQSGCSSSFILTKEEKKQLGTIAIVTTPFYEATYFNDPFYNGPSDKAVYLDIPIKTMWDGIKQGSAIGAKTALSPYTKGEWIFTLIPFTLIAGIGGGIHGVLISEDTVAEINKAEATLNRAIERTDFQKLMKGCIHNAFLDYTSYKTVIIDDINTIRDENKNYDIQDGFDTVLEINFIIDLNDVFVMQTSARLIRNQNNEIIYQILATRQRNYTLTYRKEKESFIKWSDNDAQEFLNEFNSACEAVSLKLIKIIN